ncbi:unnamed protein product [Ilex paraguariensis]|uniref:CUE domain-containing protein n=1 Tax=Ilex paraguariensis TaxID=185542 RepID=A0ABC8R3E5_9AQUA
MEPRKSTLNPHAASYVPLSKRGAADGNKDYKLSTIDSKVGNDAVWLGPHSEGMKQSRQQITEDSKLKDQPVQGFYGSSSQNPSWVTEKKTVDEEFDLDLACLEMSFPGVSDKSILDVYLANNADFEATIDMLNELELYTWDSSEKHPHTLDIGDVSDYWYSSDHATQEQKQVAAEVGVSSSGVAGDGAVSSSGSSAPAPVT